MTEHEKQELKRLLAQEVDKWAQRNPNPIIDENRWINEDGAPSKVSTAELTVFQIDPSYIHKLQVAYYAYDVLTDTISPSPFNKTINDLIIKARKICPPAVYYDHETEFRLNCDDPNWFSWFAKTFFDIPERQSHAYHYKRLFNTIYLIDFADEI